MKQLTVQQQAFVREYVRNGGRGSEAAIAAGYSKAHPAQQAYDLLGQPHIRAAVHEAQAQFIGSKLASKAIDVIKGILHDETLDATVAGRKLKFEAAKTALDRCGHIAPKAAEQTSAEEKPLGLMTVEELEAFIRDGQAKLDACARENAH